MRSPSVRLLPDFVPAEAEWLYLTNETLEGEKCIVPLLGSMVKKLDGASAFKEDLKNQFDEEVEHVRLFRGLVGESGIQGSGFKNQLFDYVKTLPKMTLRLFALQGMLEGIALGALEHRLEHWSHAPGVKVDQQAYEEEKDHVEVSIPHFKYLIGMEGACSNLDFKYVSRAVNEIFQRNFGGEAIQRVMKESFGYDVAAEDIESSKGLQLFRQRSAHTVVENKKRFAKEYMEALATC